MRLTKLIIISIIIIFSMPGFAQYSRVIQKEDRLYLSNTLIMKMKDSPRQKGNTADILFSPEVNMYLKNEGLVSASYVLPYSENKNAYVLNQVILVKYNSSKDPEIAASEVKKMPGVEWCEPKFVYETVYTPNDPMLASQYNLSKIQAQQAWDITKGDSSIIIGVVDTGVDWDHPDLAANIWVNSDEIPGNGIDDDNNGFVDDVRGWDFGGLSGTPDNNPMEDRPDHGTHVAGICAAVTDNGTGIASIGFNSTIMPVKTSRDDVRSPQGQALISYGEEGIIYAADNGAKVINLSWGGGGYSVYEQEVMNYAVSKGALVVAAAGNNSSSGSFYPASFKGVLSVAATNSDDTKASYSNYGINIDVCAPGTQIYSTWQNDSYTNATGTSMASPLTAGLAALVTYHFPQYNPLQVGEQIRVNSDDIYGINPSFNYLLGKGRINAYKALLNTNSKSVRMNDIVFTDLGDGDGIFEPGETISAEVEFTNYLSPVSNLQVNVEALNNYSSIINGTFIAGSKGTLEVFNNSSSKFTFQLNNSIPNNTELKFKLNFSDGSYSDFQLFTVLVNPSFADQTNGNILLTIASDGTVGFDDFPQNTRGHGFKYMDGDNLLFEGALMMGTSVVNLSDAARITTTRSHDFGPVQPFVISVPGTSADQQGLTIFNDNPAGTNKIGVTVRLSSYTYSNDEDDDYIILRYNIRNTNSSVITGVFAGLFFDWDFADASGDSTGFDASGDLGYVYRVAGNPGTWIGTASVSGLPTGYFGIRNDGSQGPINLFDQDGYSDNEKWLTLSTHNGPGAGPGDISMVLSSGPYDIPAGDSVDAAFAIAAGNNLDDLRNFVARARLKFNQILVDVKDENVPLPVEFSLSQNYPNPFNPTTKISYSIPEAGMVSLKLYNIMGEEIAVLVNETKEPGVYTYTLSSSKIRNLSSGAYFYRLESGNYKETRKMILLK